MNDLIAQIKGMTPAVKVLKPTAYKLLCEIGGMIQEAAPRLSDDERLKLQDLWEETVASVLGQSLGWIRLVRSREMYAQTLKALKGDFALSMTPYDGSGGPDDRQFVHSQGARAASLASPLRI